MYMQSLYGPIFLLPFLAYGSITHQEHSPSLQTESYVSEHTNELNFSF